MPTITLTTDEAGQLVGLSSKDRRAWVRFIGRIRTLADSCITFSWREPRSGPYHRWAFAQWNAVFSIQDRFSSFDEFLCWIKVGGGHCQFIPHPTRGVVAVPMSIDFASLDQHEFHEKAGAMFDFLRSSHARSVLWPHLDDLASFEMIESAIEAFQ